MIQARSLASNLTSYSTDEQDTGCKWVDDKKIYKKTIAFSALSNGASVSTRHNISNLSKIVEITGVTYQANATRWRDLNMPAGNDSSQWTIIEVDTTNVYVYSGNDQRNQSADITLYYTKTN